MVSFDKLDKVRKSKGVTGAFLCEAVGKGRHYIIDCKKTGNVPPAVLAKWAELLGTTVEYLTDQTDDPEIKKAPSSVLGDRDRMFDEIRSLWEDLPESHRQEAARYMRYLAERADKQ